jgi:hypothetical protein
MNSRILALIALSFTLLMGCNGEDAAPKKDAPAPTRAKSDSDGAAAPARDKPKATETKKVELGEQKNVILEIDGDKRRVLIKGYVCLREGQLEQFLTRKGTKEHEAVVAADLDARDIHLALTLASAEPGSPVKFRPEYQPATGSVINIFVEYEQQGKKVRRPAQEWVRSIKTKKDLGIAWVFAGSILIQDPQDPKRKPFYAANDGDVICVSNFETALLDLPIVSTAENVDLFFEAHTERIPPVQTPVLVILEPAAQKPRQQQPGAPKQGD